MQEQLLPLTKTAIDRDLRKEGVVKLLGFIKEKQPALKSIAMITALNSTPNAVYLKKLGELLCVDFRASLLDSIGEASILSATNAKALLSEIFKIISERGEGANDQSKLKSLALLAMIGTEPKLKAFRNDVATAKGITLPAFEEVARDTEEVIATVQATVDAKSEAQTAVTPQAKAKAKAKVAQAEKATTAAVKSSRSRTTAVAVAAVATATAEAPAETIAKEEGLTDEQKRAMALKGKGIIAAGAGSGKTKVLASKVKFLIKEGAKSREIIATSFSAKSGQELRSRIMAMGVKGLENRNFGTTHSIAMSLINRQDPYGYASRHLVVDKEQESLVKRAIDQVSVLPSGGTLIEPPGVEEIKDFFGEEFISRTRLVVEEEIEKNKRMVILKLVEGVSSARAALGTQAWMAQDIKYLAPMVSTPAEQWTEAQISYLEALVKKPGGRGAKALDYFNLNDDFTSKGPRAQKTAARYTEMSEDELLTPYKKPAIIPMDKWYNRGETPKSSRMKVKSGDAAKISPKEILLYITKNKGRLITPLQAWHLGEVGGETQSLNAAVYAAYEDLKAADWASDFDDKLIEACRILRKKPGALARETIHLKHILVDEAQDLNPAQHMLFGLLAGEIDENGNKKETMRAETYCLIGDDKQAIYEFRGAEPDEFISKSDQVETNGQTGDFTTTYLTTNFRSTRNIVEAANKLIAKNTRQIPMECKPRAGAEEGLITHKVYTDYAESAKASIDEIAEQIAGGRNLKASSGNHPNFGIAARTNAELIPYALELLSRGIKFKCPVNPLESPTYKAILSWMGFLSSDPKVQEDSLFNAYKTLGMRLPQFERIVRGANKASRPVVDFFLDNTSRGNLYASSKKLTQPEKVELTKLKNLYATHIERLKTLQVQSKTPVQILNAILSLKGDSKKSLMDELVELNLKDPDAAGDLIDNDAESDRGVDERDVKQAALALIQPLFNLLSRHNTIREALGELDKMLETSKKSFKKESGTDRTVREAEPDNDYVVLDTCHGWKGLECEDMYIPMPANRFPTLVESDQAKELASERRLAYVAITRGRSKVRLMCPNILLDGKTPGGVSEFVGDACVPDQDSGSSAPKQKGKKKSSALQVFAELAVLDDGLTEEELEEFYGA
jgi:superfamily I DNA/RNA helicase